MGLKSLREKREKEKKNNEEGENKENSAQPEVVEEREDRGNKSINIEERMDQLEGIVRKNAGLSLRSYLASKGQQEQLDQLGEGRKIELVEGTPPVEISSLLDLSDSELREFIQDVDELNSNPEFKEDTQRFLPDFDESKRPS